MFIRRITKLLICAAIILIAWYYFEPIKKGTGNDKSIKYELVKDWPRLPAGLKLGNPTGLAIDTNQHLVVFHRAGREWPLFGSMPEKPIHDNTILILDAVTGKLISSWGNDLFVMPHGLTVDKENNIWVTDVGLHQVLKFTHDGKLLMKLGEAGVPGKDSFHFNKPTDVAIGADGCFYVSDGYGNSRIIKFAPTGRYLFEWGRKGSGQGQFDIPHSIAIDKKGLIYVADRENHRIQVFDQTGALQKISEDEVNICAVTCNDSSGLFATDDFISLKLKHRGSDVLNFDDRGEVRTRFGRSGNYDGPTCWYHDIAIDNANNIYVGDILGNNIQKFKRVIVK